MIRHIFKKDVGQLWPLIAIVAVAEFANAALWFALGHFRKPQGLVIAAQTLPVAVLLGLIALVTAAVHQEILPGVSQDWLIRPIRRVDLVQAKLLFVLLAVQFPLLVADLTHGLAAGFALRDSLAAAASHGAGILLVISLPVLAVATMTKTLTEVIVSLLGVWILVLAGVAAGLLVRGGAPAFAASGIQWMTPAFWCFLALSAAAAIIPLQYFRRATTHSRRILGAGVLLAPLLSFTPWTSAFAVQQWLSPHPPLAETVTIAFDPDLGRSAETPGAAPANTINLGLPLRISGLAHESLLLKDHADVQLIARDGTTFFRGRTTVNPGYGDDFVVSTVNQGEVRTHQRISLPSRIYQLVGTTPVRIEIEYSLTLLRAEPLETIPATNGDRRLPGFGWCKTRLDEDGDDIELGCLKTGAALSCISAILQNSATGKRNPENISCEPDYAPYHAHFYPDSMSQSAGGIKFRDLQGLAKYPVDGSQLPAANVILKSYRPAAHFTRHLAILEIQLSDWTEGLEVPPAK